MHGDRRAHLPLEMHTQIGLRIDIDGNTPVAPTPPSENGRLTCPVWLRLGVLALCGLNLYTALGTILDYGQLQAFKLPFSLTLRVAFTGFWAIALFWLAIGAWRHQRRVLFWIGPLLTLYALFGFLWMLLFVRSSYDRGRYGFEIAITAIVLLPIWWLALRRRWLRRQIGGN